VNYPTQTHTYRDTELNLFVDGNEGFTQALIAFSQLPSEKNRKVLIDLDQDLFCRRETIAVYLKLAEYNPEITFMIEAEDPSVFLDIYPMGAFFPDNVWLGGVVASPEDWERNRLLLRRVPCAVRYMHILNPDWEMSLRYEHTVPSKGLGLNWVNVEFWGESVSKDRLASLSPFINECAAKGIPVFFEVLPQDLERLDNPEVFPQLRMKQWPADPELRDPDWRKHVLMASLGVTVEEGPPDHIKTLFLQCFTAWFLECEEQQLSAPFAEGDAA
jgi:hypothetical protein